MTSLTDNATTIEIKGAKYNVEAIEAGECGVSAVWVTKRITGESYDVIRTREDVVECSCPDFVARHEGKGTCCKHGTALVGRGFLPTAPAPVASKPNVAPVTPADRKRASYFGLRISAAPPAAPAVEQVIKAEEQVPVEPDADDLGPAGDSWETWVEDDARWNLGPDAEPITPARSDIDLTGFASKTMVVEPAPIEPFEDHRRGERVALLITTTAIETGDDGAYFRLDHDDREAFWGFVGSIGWGAGTWRGWLALCRSGSPVDLPEPPAHKPTWNPRVEPIPVERAEAAAIFRDNGAGGYVVVRRKAARPMAGHSEIDPRDVHHAELCEAGAYFAPRYAI
jgi:hypothetical protein